MVDESFASGEAESSFVEHQADETPSVEQQIRDSFDTFNDVLNHASLSTRLRNFAAILEVWPDGMPSASTPEYQQTLDEVAGLVAARAARDGALVFNVAQRGARSRNEGFERSLDALVISGSEVPSDLFRAARHGSTPYSQTSTKIWIKWRERT